MRFVQYFFAAILFSGASALLPVNEARAELVLSQLIVDLESGKNARQDIEAWNNGPDIAYVAVEPREVVGAGTPAEARRENPDPEVLGLLVSPARMVLQAGQRKLLRVAAIGGTADRERVYRVTIKPVVGQLSTEQSGLKILVGYDVLVLVRPKQPQPRVSGTRAGNVLILRNEGNVSVELQEGKECDADRKACQPLPGGRLYAGAEKRVTVNSLRSASYVMKMANTLIPREF